MILEIGKSYVWKYYGGNSAAAINNFLDSNTIWNRGVI